VKIMVVLGSGGHTAEMVRLTEAMGPNEYEYVVASDDPLSPGKTIYPGTVHRVLNPRSRKDRSALHVALKTLVALAQSAWVVGRSRAEVIVSCGPAIAVPVMLAGKLTRKRLVFIEHSARVRSRSTTGRLLYPLVDLFLVQWPSMQHQYKRAVWRGRLM
jgi:beta-1,4-N-acetylglucosaminyltransferase